MGAAASVEGFESLPEEKKAELKTKFDALIAEGKSEDEAMEACKAAAAEIAAETSNVDSAAEAPAAAETSAATEAPAEGEAAADALAVKTIPLTELKNEIDLAVAAGKTPLIVDNSEEDKVNTFFQYGSACMIDGKKMGLDKTMQNIPVPDIMEEARQKLATSLKLGQPVVFALTKSCTDFAGTFTDTVAKENTALAMALSFPSKCSTTQGRGF